MCEWKDIPVFSNNESKLNTRSGKDRPKFKSVLHGHYVAQNLQKCLLT